MAEVEVSKDMTINQIIKQYPKSVGVFNKFNIDSCCGGSEKLETAAKNAGVDINTVISEIRKAIEG